MLVFLGGVNNALSLFARFCFIFELCEKNGLIILPVTEAKIVKNLRRSNILGSVINYESSPVCNCFFFYILAI